MIKIEVNNISKFYKIYTTNFQKLIFNFISVPEDKKFYALRNVSFSLNEGDHLGIIGNNGSGKSTLLKILSGITKPSFGNYKLNGKVFSILELGLGFNDDFTGRENIELTYSLYGIESHQLKNYITNVYNFSELGNFFDMPVRKYSNGMKLRLAFSAAVYSNPKIFIIDEALSVGDIDFQKKCFDMINLLKKNGTSLIYVSHDLNSLKTVCNKAILIDGGSIVEFGNVEKICNLYLKKKFKNTNIKVSTDEKSNFEKCEIKKIFLTNKQNKKNNKFHINEEIIINLEVEFYENTNPTIGFMIKNKYGLEIFGTNTDLLNFYQDFKAGNVIIFKFKLTNNLNFGKYFLNCGIFEKNKNNFLHRKLNDTSFEVFNDKISTSTSVHGLLNLPVEFSFEKS